MYRDGTAADDSGEDWVGRATVVGGLGGRATVVGGLGGTATVDDEGGDEREVVAREPPSADEVAIGLVAGPGKSGTVTLDVGGRASELGG